MAYRRRWGTDTWHWCLNCSQWPQPLEAEERAAKPLSGELCAECSELDRDEVGEPKSD
jgi:hypothetical protein